MQNFNISIVLVTKHQMLLLLKRSILILKIKFDKENPNVISCNNYIFTVSERRCNGYYFLLALSVLYYHRQMYRKPYSPRVGAAPAVFFLVEAWLKSRKNLQIMNWKLPGGQNAQNVSRTECLDSTMQSIELQFML